MLSLWGVVNDAEEVGCKINVQRFDSLIHE